MSESIIERNLKIKVESLMGECIKFTSPGNSGMPDRLVILPGGRVYFVELKSTYGTLSGLQKRQQKRLKELGQKVYNIYCLDQVDEFINEVLR